jgi:tRNA threonylcarbamoyl adenosine modification protein YeaZ
MLCRYTHHVIGRGHAEAVVPAVAALLAGERVEAIMVDVGPGSFTGIRIGIAAARALGVAWGVPVAGFSGTALVAAAAFAAEPALPAVTAVIDAGRGQRFCQRINRDYSAGEVQTLATEALATAAGTLAGDVPEPLSAVMRGLPDCRFALQLPPTARSLPPMAHYVRPPDAILPL